MRVDRGTVAADQRVDADRDQHAVDRLGRAMAFQQVEERPPPRRVDGRVRILRRIAAGGVDQHRLIGEPEVQIAGATHPLHRLFDEGKAQARMEQGGRLARTRRADDDIPGACVEIVAPPAARLAQLGDRLAHAAAEFLAFLLGGVGTGEFGGDRLGRLARLAPPQPPPQPPAEQDDDDPGDPHAPRTEEGHEQRQPEDEQRRQDQRGGDRHRIPVGEEAFHQ